MLIVRVMNEELSPEGGGGGIEGPSVMEKASPVWMRPE
jgi:hypothetical protein